MKLICPKYGFADDLIENQILVLNIENPAAFSEMIQSLWQQVYGSEGIFLLSNEEDSLSLPKSLDLIMNPFEVNCDNRKILSGLYKELASFSVNEFQEETGTLNSNIVSYLDKLCMQVPYSLSFNLDLDPVNLCKLYEVHIDSQPSSLLEKLEDYIRAVHQILRKHIFVFVNLKQFLPIDVLNEFYKFCTYEKVQVILMERFYISSISDYEKQWILDKDLCLIATN